MPTTTNPSAPLHGDYRDFSKGGRYGPTGENAPVQIGVENGRNQFDYWQTDPAAVNEYLAAHSDDPKIIQAASRGSDALDHELHSRGIRVPEHYKAAMGQDGKVIVAPMSWWDKHSNWAMPALMMGGAIAAGPLIGAMSGGGGAAGAVPATTGLGGSGFGAGGGLGITGAGAAGTGGLASTAIGIGAVPSIAGTSSTLGAGGGGWGALAKAAGSRALQQGTGRLIGAATDSMANNRGARLASMMDADQIATQRQGENRAEREDTWKKLQQADYTLNPRGPQFGQFGSTFTPRPLTDPMRQGAEGLQRESLTRLTQGPQIRPLTDADKEGRMGGWEKFLNVAGPVASYFGY